ncbi:MAG TPA: hypothetical protein ENK57_26385 [Polyangiaceae bacterium]|nr:hypothetical protein [Polyangiaceae bacterium]
MRVFLLAAALLVGCASTDDDRFRAPEHATWGDWEDGSGAEPRPELSRTIFQGPDGPYEAITDGDGRTVVPQAPLARDRPSRPPRVGPRSVKLRKAPLESALRLLADAGQFNLLLEGDLSQSVSGDLKNVDPYEALRALASAHGAYVRFDGQIVVVTADEPEP